MSSEVTRRKVDNASKAEKDKDEVVDKGSPSKKKAEKEKETEDDSDLPPRLRYGPMPRFSKQRLWSRGILIVGLLVIVWYNSGKSNEQSFASVDDDIPGKAMKTKCSAKFDASIKPYPKCNPKQCGRFVVDNLFSPQEIYSLEYFMKRIFKESNVEGAATVFDFSLGRLQSEGDVKDLYKLNQTRPIFEKSDKLIYDTLKEKLQRLVSSYFGVDHWSLLLASPFYMTKLTRKYAKKASDEYWHPAVHQLQFKYQYSTILFMTDNGKEIDGGRLIFIDGDNTNRTVDSKIGRAIAFTSGEESVHYTERIRKGVRYAITAGFTCNPKDATKEPKF